MFYLVKGTFRSRETGQVIINKNEISEIMYMLVDNSDEKHYLLVISMNNDTDIRAWFNKEKEVKQALRDLGVNEEIIDSYEAASKNADDEKKKNILDALEKLKEKFE